MGWDGMGWDGMDEMGLGGMGRDKMGIMPPATRLQIVMGWRWRWDRDGMEMR